MPLLFTVHNTDESVTTVYSVHCDADNHQVHCEGGIYNLIKGKDGQYHFDDHIVPRWLLTYEEEINQKISEHHHPPEPIAFHLKYSINGRAVDCSIRQVHVKDASHYLVSTLVNDEPREYLLNLDANTGKFCFDGEDIPKELKIAEDDISDAIQFRTQ
jgi:hypothetical protein